MIKVLYIVSTLKRTGPINVLFNLISEIDKTVFQPIILTLSPDDPRYYSLKHSFEDIGVNVYSLNLSRIGGMLKSKAFLRKFILAHHIQVIHLNGIRADILIKKSDYPKLNIISTINSNIYDDYTMLYGFFFGKIMALLHIRCLKNKVAVGCSQFVASELNKRYKSSLRYIYNGIPKDLYSICNVDEKLLLREHLHLPHKIIFIFVGYLIYRKDPITVLKGFINAENKSNLHLLMIGDGPLMENCKKIAQNHSNISFMGNQPETLKFLNASDYYISAAYSEGLPTSVMEALGCGLPVILSDIKPHRELISKIPDLDYTFPVNNPQILSKQINSIVLKDYQSLSRKSREIIDESFNSTLMAQQYQKLYIKYL